MTAVALPVRAQSVPTGHRESRTSSSERVTFCCRDVVCRWIGQSWGVARIFVVWCVDGSVSDWMMRVGSNND